MNATLSTLLLLARTGRRSPDRILREATPALMVLFSILLGAIILTGVIIYVIRVRALRSETTKDDMPLSLGEVRRMHRQGEISDEEMKRLKAVVIGRSSGESSETPPQEQPPEEEEPTQETPPQNSEEEP